MNLQEEILKIKNELLDEFDKRIEALKVDEQEFPQVEDDYWYVDDDTEVMGTVWYGVDSDQGRVSIDNVFKTKDQAEFAAEKLRVEAELRKFSRPFIEGEDNWYMALGDGFEAYYMNDSIDPIQGVIYFDSLKRAHQATGEIGAERIKKYIFGVEAE